MKASKDLTREDCEQFRRDHPDAMRSELSQHYTAWHRAMKRLGCLDEMYPKRRCRGHYDLTLEDCQQFRREHPDMNRKQLYKHHIIYANAMKRLGCFDELWPAEEPECRLLTLEDCQQFRREHPDMRRKELRHKHLSYWNAMKRLGCLDELFPARKILRYDDAYLIERARHYLHVRDLNQNEPQVLRAIYFHGIEQQALKHMVPIGNKKWKLIYVYEFPDHSAYVGLTYDQQRRKKEHRRQENSAVRRHIAKTGMQPVYRELTGLLPVDEACNMEGVWESRYRNDGWTILNVRKTGGIGGSSPRVDRSKLISMFRKGVPPKEISRLMGINDTTVYKILRQEGLSGRGISTVRIEVIGDDGEVIETWSSVKAAAKHYGIHPANLSNAIIHHHRVRGRYMRHNIYTYKIKYGKEPPESKYFK